MLIFGGGRPWVFVLVGGEGLGDVVGWKRAGGAVDGKLFEAHFGVPDPLGGLCGATRLEPSGPACAALIGAHRRVVVGAVALLVCLLASLGLFKAGSACN